MELLEQYTKSDISWVYYNKAEREEHDSFMQKYVFPLYDETKEKWFQQWRLYNLFVLAYNILSESVKRNIKPIFDEYRILYFKSKIQRILDLWLNWPSLRDYNNYMRDFYWSYPEEFDKFVNEKHSS